MAMSIRGGNSGHTRKFTGVMSFGCDLSVTLPLSVNSKVSVLDLNVPLKLLCGDLTGSLILVEASDCGVNKIQCLRTSLSERGGLGGMVQADTLSA